MGIFDQDKVSDTTEDATEILNDLNGVQDSEINSEVLSSLVGDGKKFKSVEALAAGKIRSDAFIEKLISEKRALEAELTEKKKLEDFMTELRTLNSKSVEPSNERDTSQFAEQPQNGMLDESALLDKVFKALEEKNRTTVEARNVAQVRDELQKAYGPSWKGVLKQYADSMGMDEETVDRWVKANPSAVLKSVVNTVGGARSNAPVNAPASRMSIPGGPTFAGSEGMTRYADFQKVKAKDPALYRSREFQVKLHDAAVKYGDAFFAKPTTT